MDQAVDQRRRGLPADGPRPRRRRAAARAVRRARRGAAAEEIAAMRGGLRGRRRHARCFVTDDPDEGELFVAARRAGVPGDRARAARCCSRTSACRCRCCPTCSPAIAEIAAAHDVEIPVVAHAGDGNTHPIIVYDPPTTPTPSAARRAAFGEVMAARDRARRHHHRRARRRPAQAARAARPARPRRDGADPADQGRPRPAGHPQPRRRILRGPPAAEKPPRPRPPLLLRRHPSPRAAKKPLPDEASCQGSSGGEDATRRGRPGTASGNAGTRSSRSSAPLLHPELADEPRRVARARLRLLQGTRPSGATTTSWPRVVTPTCDPGTFVLVCRRTAVPTR